MQSVLAGAWRRPFFNVKKCCTNHFQCIMIIASPIGVNMKYMRHVTTVFLILSITALSGCNSKQEKTGQKTNAANPLQKGDTGKAGPLDETEAAALKDRVLARVKGGEFSAIYKDASDGFRAVGPEQRFLEVWQRQQEETGAFKDAKEISHTVRPDDKFQVFVYDVGYEKKHKALRLTFGRSKKGVMELTGINQKDVPTTAK